MLVETCPFITNTAPEDDGNVQRQCQQKCALALFSNPATPKPWNSSSFNIRSLGLTPKQTVCCKSTQEKLVFVSSGVISKKNAYFLLKLFGRGKKMIEPRLDLGTFSVLD